MDGQPGIQEIIQFIAWDRAPYALIVLVGGLILVGLIGRFLDDVAERWTERRLTLKKIKALTRFVLYVVIAGVVGGSLFQLQASTLLAVAGAIGVGVGLALQDVLASLMAGVILLLDEPFQVGDRVSFEGYYGEITEIGLRSVRLVTLDDNLVTIPNSAFLSKAVASANAGALDCMVVIPIYIAAAEDFYRARRIVQEATVTSRYVYLEKPVVMLVSDEFLGERFVTVIRSKAYVFDARYEKAYVTDVTERVKTALRAAGIRGPDQQYRDIDIFRGRETPPSI